MYKEYAKCINILQISANNRRIPEKNFKYSLSILYRFDSAKKLSYATVPLIEPGELREGFNER